MTFKLSKNSIQNRSGVDSRLIEISDLALTLSPIDFGHPRLGGLRTVEEQRSLYDTGVTKCNGIENKSKHQSGKALDFYAFVDGKASWDVDHLTQVAAAFMQASMILGYRIKWGGLWKSFKDYPHVELIGE
jgi:peptidoglycan L-alanyl-D-glutamate endopeptidase CwlK